MRQMKWEVKCIFSNSEVTNHRTKLLKETLDYLFFFFFVFRSITTILLEDMFQILKKKVIGLSVGVIG